MTTRLTRTLHPVQNLDPAWSPTGEAIAFSRNGLSATSRAASLYQLHVGGIAPARLTNPTGVDGDVDPVYSPDGRQIAFSSDRNGYDDVYMTVTKDRDVEPTFAPDGSALAYVSDRSGATEIWAQSLLTLAPGPASPFQITSDGASKSHPSWGPDVQTSPATTSKSPLPPIAVAPPAA